MNFNLLKSKKKNTLQTVNFSDLKNSWSSEDYLNTGVSKPLTFLAYKIKVWNCGTYNMGTRNKKNKRLFQFINLKYYEKI